MLKIVNNNSVFYRIYNPVFPHIGSAVFIEFDSIIGFRVGGGSDFNDPVRRTDTALVIELVVVADDREVRFDIVLVIFV